jgi:hypothetical protein
VICRKSSPFLKELLLGSEPIDLWRFFRPTALLPMEERTLRNLLVGRVWALGSALRLDHGRCLTIDIVRLLLNLRGRPKLNGCVPVPENRLPKDVDNLLLEVDHPLVLVLGKPFGADRKHKRLCDVVELPARKPKMRL